MATYVYWFSLGLVLLGLEITTGTFYILVFAIAMAIGGIAALLQFSIFAQVMIAAVAGVLGTLILRWIKSRWLHNTPAIDMDVGRPISVVRWHDDGTARVNYRGAEWDAEVENVDASRTAPLYIKAIRGSVLILTHNKFN